MSVGQSVQKLAQVLSEAVEAGTNVYVHTTPEILDFTDPEAKAEVTVMGQGGNIASVPITAENVCVVAGLLKVSVFAKGMKIIAWNWKSLATYLWAKTGKPYPVEGSIVDLKVIELYAGVKDKDAKAPDSLAGALNRLKKLIVDGTWKEIQNTYQKVHLPLITTVVPAMEIAGILNTELARKVHACYSICAGDNGRMKCHLGYKDGYVPHAMSETEKGRLIPRQHDELFMLFDFKNYEVSVLQYLSKDEKLGEVLEAADPYSAIYELVTGVKDDPDCRNKAKKMFLPVIYGAGASALVRSMGIPQATAEKIISRIHALFPLALRWVESFQEQAKTGSAKDCFGKRRFFDEGEDFLARNFSIQSPASTICFDKLVRLHHATGGAVAYNVHDGFGVYAAKDNWKEVFQKGYAVLTSESDLCPGLRLKVACHAGRNLNGLKPLLKAKGAQ